MLSYSTREMRRSGEGPTLGALDAQSAALLMSAVPMGCGVVGVGAGLAASAAVGEGMAASAGPAP